MGSTYDFVVNMSEIGRFGSPILFCIFMDEKYDRHGKSRFCPVTFSGALAGTILSMQVDLSLSPVFISSLGMGQNNRAAVFCPVR